MQVNIDARLTKLYDLLENDILSRISGGQHYISPYKVPLLTDDRISDATQENC